MQATELETQKNQDEKSQLKGLTVLIDKEKFIKLKVKVTQNGTNLTFLIRKFIDNYLKEN